MECREAVELFPAHADRVPAATGRTTALPEGPSARALAAHLSGCASCRAELAQYRELSAALAALAARTIDPPAWLLPSLLDTVAAHAARRHRIPVAALTRPRVAAAGGAALVLAGLAAGAVVVRGRHRRRSAAPRLSALPA